VIDYELNNPSRETEFEIKSSEMWFGQLAKKYTLPPSLIKKLNDEIDSRQDHPDWNDYLAGHLEYQKMIYFKDNKGEIKQSVSDAFVEVFKNLAHDYLNLLPHVKSFKTDLVTIWYNDQKQYDYNPIHSHNGRCPVGITGVLYLKVPEGINEGRKVKQFFNNTSANGRTHLFSNSASQLSRRCHLPPLVEGDFYIFPYDMQHLVYPFTADVIRRSLSFNMDVFNTEYTE
tara:strand:- start:1830 stop:2516 length:687 start_codon:yes stop_codon:yes gene_type:complete